MNLFTYGSLMFDAVWSRLVSVRYESATASLSGHVRKCVNEDSYPAVIEGCSEGSVDGVLYFDISTHDLDLLDRFEGEYFSRETVHVQLTTGKLLPAEIYLLKDEFRHLASERDWNPSYFATIGINHFLERYADELKAFD